MFLTVQTLRLTSLFSWGNLGLLVVCLNPLVVTWQNWWILLCQTEKLVQITLFRGSLLLCGKYGLQCPDDLSWLCCFFHGYHFHIPWKLVKSYQVVHAFQSEQDWSHLLPGTIEVPQYAVQAFLCVVRISWIVVLVPGHLCFPGHHT